MRILHVCAEFYPLLKTGGLADVTGALPFAQLAMGDDVRVLLPGFPAFTQHIPTITVACLDTFAGKVILRYGHYRQLALYLVDAPHLYHRPGHPYHDGYSNAYQDNYLRFALLGWLASILATGIDPYWQPNIVHCHDWHAGLACSYIKQQRTETKTVLTIHNLAYQGLFSLCHFDQLNLNHFSHIEFYHQLSYLKAGIVDADQVTTVSPTYAKEILTEPLGMGMEGVLQQCHQQRRLTGIINGADYHVWHPYRDKSIITRYSQHQLVKKKDNKSAIQEQMGLPQHPQVLLCCVVSRLSDQKGLDLLADALPTLFNAGGQFILLGDGDEALKRRYQVLLQRYPQQVALYFGYDETLAHQLIAGCDLLLMPSRFEPCGLTQMYALKYGTLPVVHHTGGLADTVIDDGTPQTNGYQFQPLTVANIKCVLTRVLVDWLCPSVWQIKQKAAMNTDYSWRISAKSYKKLYRKMGK